MRIFRWNPRLSWFRATHAAKKYDVTVLCADPYDQVRCNVDAKVLGLEVVAVPHTAFERMLINSPAGFYLAYRLSASPGFQCRAAASRPPSFFARPSSQLLRLPRARVLLETGYPFCLGPDRRHTKRSLAIPEPV